MNDTIIATQDLTRRFDKLLAVDRLNMQVGRGQVYGFLGPNGAGKTTTVRMLAALISPTSGAAWVDGIALGSEANDTQIRRHVGILTESPGLYDKLSATDNLRFYARLYEVPSGDIAARVQQLLQMMGLWERRADKVGGFSKGMRQKMAIARAMVHRPPLLFLDEPTSGLDPEAARLVRDFIETLRSEGGSIFLTTHNLDEADRLCDRVGVFKQRLIREDTPANLRRQLFGRRVEVQLAQPLSEQQSATLRELPFISDIQTVANSQHPTISIGLSDPEAQNPILVRKLVELGAAVQFVTPLEASLEDVYFSLVNEGEKPQ